MSELRNSYRLGQLDLNALNRVLGQLADRIDELEGRRGTPTFWADVDANGNAITNVADATADTDAPSYRQVRTRPASQIPANPVPSTGSTDTSTVQDELDGIDGGLAAHLADYADPHETQASQVESSAYQAPAGAQLTASDVQSALEELQDELDTLSLRYSYPWEAAYQSGGRPVNGACDAAPPHVHYDDLQGNVTTLATVGVGVPNIVQVNSTPVYAYEITNEAVAGNEKRLRASYQFSHRYQQEGAVELHLHLITGARVPAVDEYVRCTFDYNWGEFRDVVAGSSTLTGLLKIPAGTAAYTRLYADVGWIDGTGQHESSILAGLWRRTSSNAADTYEDTVYLEWLDVHFPVEKPGTPVELPVY